MPEAPPSPLAADDGKQHAAGTTCNLQHRQNCHEHPQLTLEKAIPADTLHKYTHKLPQKVNGMNNGRLQPLNWSCEWPQSRKTARGTCSSRIYCLQKLLIDKYLRYQNQPQGTQYLTSILREQYCAEIIAPSKHRQEKGRFPSKIDSKYYPECS